MEIRRSYDRLISTMGFPILVRWHLYIESGPCKFPHTIPLMRKAFPCHDVIMSRQQIPPVGVNDTPRWHGSVDAIHCQSQFGTTLSEYDGVLQKGGGQPSFYSRDINYFDQFLSKLRPLNFDLPSNMMEGFYSYWFHLLNSFIYCVN